MELTSSLRRKDLFAHFGVFIACILPSIFVTIWGIGRPYDAIPDQDMLWVSEALRAMRGVSPSYADHPGAFWSIVFRINIDILRWDTSQEVVDKLGRITAEGIQRLINLSRAENGIICGATAYLMFPLARSLSIPIRLAALIALISGYSSAILVGISEVRHETIGVAFMILSILFYSRSIKFSSKSSWKYFHAAASAAALAAAAYSKNQTLILFPLYFLACIAIYLKNKDSQIQVNKIAKSKRLIKKALGLSAVSSILWIFSATPDIDLINLPFWIAINSGTGVLIGAQMFGTINWKNSYKGLALLGMAQILIFRLLSPQWWRQAVTGFPSWMFRYANSNDNPETNIFEQTTKGINQYFQGIATPSALAIGLWILILGSLAAALYVSHNQSYLLADWELLGVSSAWIFCTASILANSQRLATRYEIYILLPTLMTAAYSTSFYTNSTSSRVSLPKNILRILSTLLIGTMSLSSITNIPKLRSFILIQQPREWVCIGHHMDRSMSLTSAGHCEVFPAASKEKDLYDAWTGPR